MAWYALRYGDVPPFLDAEIDLYQERTVKIGPLLRRAGKVAIFGGLILAVALAWEAVYSEANPNAGVHHPSSLAAEMVTAHLWMNVMQEVGFAFLIASVVAFFIEYRAKIEQNDLLKVAIQDIGHSVIEGVYRIRHDQDYIRTVVNSCLAVRNIRRDYTIVCNVSEFTAAECDELGIIPNTLVKVHCVLKYDSINIGNDYAVFEGKYYIPKRSGKLDPFARVTYLQVGDKVYTQDEIRDREIKPDSPNYISSDRSYTFEIPSHPQKPVDVHIESTFAKERSDNEIFSFLLPTVGATIQFFFEVPGLRIGAKARTASNEPEAQTFTEGHHIEWKVKGPLIPNNYVTVWWRSATADGEPEAECVAIASTAPDGVSLLIEDAAPPSAQSGTSAGNEGLQPRRTWVKGPLRWLSPSSWRRE